MNLDSIKNKEWALEKDGKISVFITVRTRKAVYTKETDRKGITKKVKRFADKNNYDIHHNLNVRGAIYGYRFSSYNPNMDFTLALESGWTKIF